MPPSSIGDRRRTQLSRSAGKGRRDQLEQGALVMPPRGDHQAPDVALAEQQVIMLDQPRTGARHELGLVEDGGRFPTKIGYEPAFGMQREFAAAW